MNVGAEPITASAGRVRAYLAAHDAMHADDEGAGGPSTGSEVARLITTKGAYRLLIDDLRALTTRGSTPPTVLADPIDEHRLPESDDPPTGTERDDLRRALLGSWADDRNVIAAYRAGWDRGVNDHAEAIERARGGDDQ